MGGKRIWGQQKMDDKGKRVRLRTGKTEIGRRGDDVERVERRNKGMDGWREGKEDAESERDERERARATVKDGGNNQG